MKYGININLNKPWAINSEHDAKYKTNTEKVDTKMEQKTWNIAKMNIEHEKLQKMEYLHTYVENK